MLTLRPVLCCLAAALLTACASFSPHSDDHPARQYHGVVLDAKTGAPLGYVSVTAYRQPFSLPYLAPPDYLGFTLTRADGTFDLETPAASQPANHLEAIANAPLTNDILPHKGELTGYNGVLDHVSSRRTNTILVRELHAR